MGCDGGARYVRSSAVYGNARRRHADHDEWLRLPCHRQPWRRHRVLRRDDLRGAGRQPARRSCTEQRRELHWRHSPVARRIRRRGLPGPCLPDGLRNADRFFPQQRAVMSLQRPARRRGFTLAELVMTIVIIGILIAVTAPRFVSWKGFSSRGTYDEAQAVVRFAQKTAIAWRRTIYVCVSATEISAISSADCAAPAYLKHPLTNADLRSPATAGVTLSPVGNFSFNGLGSPNAAVTITLTSPIADDPTTRLIVVESETG